MIELVVVIGIIGLLLTILVPAVNALLESNRSKTTLSTMKVLENAIERYKSERPLGGIVDAGTLPPDYFLWEPDTPPPIYEYWNPATDDANSNGRWDYGEVVNDDQTQPEDEGRGWWNRTILTAHFPQVSLKDGVQRRINNAWVPAQPNFAERDYRSIESLYFYMSQLSPQGRQILNTLPQSIVQNKDQCGGATCPDIVILGIDKASTATPPPFDPNGKRIELVEVNDAWGRPLRYKVRPLASEHEWELRSAGPDGKFSFPFTPQEQSDDVPLRGR